jgi:hypothetical protein
MYLGRGCIGRRPVCLCGLGCVRVFVLLCCGFLSRFLLNEIKRSSLTFLRKNKQGLNLADALYFVMNHNQ